MQLFKITVTILSIILIGGCSSSFKLAVPESENPEIKKIYISGYEEAVSIIDSVVLCVAGEKTEDGYLRFAVYCKNFKEEPINLMPEKIYVVGYGNGEKSNLYVYSPDKFLKKIKKAQARALALQSIFAGLESYNAGYKTSTTHVAALGTAYDSDGNQAYGVAYGTSNTKTYDAQAASEARARNQQMINQQAERYNSDYNTVNNSLLKTSTLFPGQQIIGDVMVDYASGYSDRFDVTISVGHTIHHLVFLPKEN